MNVNGMPKVSIPRRSVQAGGGIDPAMGPFTAAPMAAQTSYTAAGPSAGELLANVFNGIVALLKNLFQSVASLFGPRSTTAPSNPAPFPGAPTAPAVPNAPAPANWQALAQQYGLYPTEQNVQAFMAEAQQNQADGALGPGSNQTQAIRDVQAALAGWGYRLAVTGVFDASTQAAVVAFKRNEGIVQSYRATDGSWAVNGLADARTLDRMMQKLQGQVVAQPQAPAQPQIPVQPQAPVQPQPPVQNQPNLAAIATQYRLLNTPENVQAFLAEVQRYPVDGALGPGSNNQKAIQDLQGALAMLGYQVVSNGSYDAATQQAVIAYKQARGIQQSYRSADGQFAVNEYADSRMLDVLMNELQSRVQQQPAAPVPQSLPGVTTYPAPVSQPGDVRILQPEGVRLLQPEAPRLSGAQAPVSYAPSGMTSVMPNQTPLSQGDGVRILQPEGVRLIGPESTLTPASQPPQVYQAPQAPQAAPQMMSAPQAPQAAPQVPSQPVPDTRAIAAQYGLLDSPENVQAFMAEVRTYQQSGALGPGSTQTQPIQDLQTILARLGFTISATGQYDEATSQAVIAYKQRFGLHSSYRAANGTWAVNEYADPAMLDDLTRRLESQMPQKP